MASQASHASGSERISISRVLGWAFGVFKANPGVMLVVTLVFSILPAMLLGLLSASAEDAAADGEFAAMIGAGFLSVVGSIVLYLVVQAVIVRATYSHAVEEREAGLGETIGAALPVLVPLLLFTILSSLGMMFGFMLLFVPGIILFVMWSVGAPALIVEKLGPVAALGRSRALTKGNRWRIFGLFILIFVMSAIIAAVLVGLIVGAYAAGGGIDALENADGGIAAVVVEAVISGIGNAFSAAVGAALYVELRHRKEGPDTRSLEDIFA